MSVSILLNVFCKYSLKWLSKCIIVTQYFRGTNIRQVIIDECGMCMEPESLVPLVAVKPEQIVLIGGYIYDHSTTGTHYFCNWSMNVTAIY